MTMLTIDLLLLVAAVVSVVVIFAGVLIVGDFDKTPVHLWVSRNTEHNRS